MISFLCRMVAGRWPRVNTDGTRYPTGVQTVTDLTMYIANKIKELRVAAGLTQTALAEGLHVTPNTISRWESGTYQPSIKDLERLSRRFQKPIRVFFPSEVQPATEEQRALLSATGDLRGEDVEELQRYADFIRARRLQREAKGRRPRKQK